MTRHLDPAMREKGLCISIQRNTGMLRGVYPEPLHCVRGRSQAEGERAQHDGGRLMCFTNLPNTTPVSIADGMMSEMRRLG